MNKRLQGILCLTLSTVIWGSAFVAQSKGMDYIGPFTFQTVRCFLALIVLLPIIALSDRLKHTSADFFHGWKNPTLWKAGISCGIPLCLATNFQQIGLVNTDAGKSAFLTAMYMVIIPIFGIFRKKRLSKWIWISIALAVCGLYFLCCMGVEKFLLSDGLTLICALLFAVQITYIDKYAQSVDALRLNFIQILVTFILSAIPMVLSETVNWDLLWSARYTLSYAGCLSLGIAYFMQILGQKHLQPTVASIIMSLESVFAVIFGCLLLKEKLSLYELIGCILMFIAVILSQLPEFLNKKELSQTQ